MCDFCVIHNFETPTEKRKGFEKKNLKSTQLIQHAKFMTTNKKHLMGKLDPDIQSAALLSLNLCWPWQFFAEFGSISLGALTAAIRRGIKFVDFIKFCQKKRSQIGHLLFLSFLSNEDKLVSIK
tara:strand:+ start:743 stop:1114 length:372 start_codon:yes stop_codon:yes gene_type:complete